jgi:transcriptional regulator with XRE-family HTH domain
MSEKARSKVRQWLEAEGLTQARAAERLGVSQGAVSQLLNGTTAAPSLGLAQALERETKGAIRATDWDAHAAKGA